MAKSRFVSIIALLLLTLTAIYCGNGDSQKGDINKDNEFDTSVHMAITSSGDTITLCSFNIMWLGNYLKKDEPSLADIIKDYDIVVVQELLAPPIDGTYPDGEDYESDPQAKKFFDAMEVLGFAYWLSEEDTGTNDNIHVAGSSTEWWVTFYKSNKVARANDLPHGFLADDRSNHDDYERVPYAFSFRTTDSKMDFVLISVHLKPGNSNNDMERRKHELSSIAAWIDNNDDQEKDLIILGDMNIEDSDELVGVTPDGYLSLNDECYSTNTLGTDDEVKGKPYDHIMYNTFYTTEIDTDYDFEMIDLVATMADYWETDDPYPGEPYNHNLFKQYYSDHHPIDFKIVCQVTDDD